jgi:hypothetical protein
VSVSAADDLLRRHLERSLRLGVSLFCKGEEISFFLRGVFIIGSLLGFHRNKLNFLAAIIAIKFKIYKFINMKGNNAAVIAKSCKL